MKPELMFILRINSPQDHPFFEEHYNILKKNKSVWFLKLSHYTKNINVDTIKRTIKNGNYVLIRDSKENNSNSYLCTFDDLSLEHALNNYPKYYDSQNIKTGLWVHITSIEKIDNVDKYLNDYISCTGCDLSKSLKSSAPMIYIKLKD